MSLRHLISHGRTLSLGVASRKALDLAFRQVKAGLSSALRTGRSSFARRTGHLRLAPPPGYLGRLQDAPPAPLDGVLRELCRRYQAHEFDLLGSGWTKVAYGVACAGFDGHLHPPGRPLTDGAGPERRLSPGNRGPAAEIRRLITDGYVPIDWQLDFRSGYRWREDRWSAGIMLGHEPGADIKVPWELARLQHLPQLALAATRAGDGRSVPLRHECIDQMLDFIAANPPGYGVNWACTMDVAIRAANLVMARWLLISSGEQTDDRFDDVLASSLLAHGRHIMGNLEGTPEFRGNHYLADVCGLAFVAAALTGTEETTRWWNFAVAEIVAEAGRQFNADGSNYEGSTSYHRLSAEMLVYATALVLGRDGAARFPAGFAERLYRMARFSIDITKPNGRVAQIGDNDNGRFFKLCPGQVGDDLEEDHLDHRGLAAAAGALVAGAEDLAVHAGPRFEVERAIVSALAGGRRLTLDRRPETVSSHDTGAESGDSNGEQHETRIVLPDPSVLNGLVAIAYPDFGLFIWKSDRCFLAVRCGPIGQNGRGGHAHNDQLSVEMNVDGDDWLADPGSYVYTAAPRRRDVYRSVLAHAAPRLGDREPARLDLGMFRLSDDARAGCLYFDAESFEGRHVGYGTPVHRAIRIEGDAIRIRDRFGGAVDWRAPAETTTVSNADELRRHFGMALAFSPGYGSTEAG